MSSKNKPFATKASEGQIVQWFCALLGIPKVDRLGLALEMAVDAGVHRGFVRALVHADAEVYAWNADVMSEVLLGDGSLIAETVANEGHMLLVRDSKRSAANSLWLVVSDAPTVDPLAGYPYRSVSNHITFGDRKLRCTAYHVASCLREDG